jgi:ribosomal protein L29
MTNEEIEESIRELKLSIRELRVEMREGFVAIKEQFQRIKLIIWLPVIASISQIIVAIWRH